MANPPQNPVANLNWASTPAPAVEGFHDRGHQSWRYDAGGVFLAGKPDPLRTDGEPKTVEAILAVYGSEIFSASMTGQIPPELIVMTIATETAMFRSVNFTGPKTFRWENHVGAYSAGPMQILDSTAREVINKLHLDFQPQDVPPQFTSKPSSPPSNNPLYDGDTCILLGTAEINRHRNKTGLDPILVAARYNAGSLIAAGPTPDNPWGLRSHGDHLNRAAAWYGDACEVLGELRNGKPLDTSPVIDQPATADPEDTARQDFVLRNLTREEATAQAEDLIDSGADVLEAEDDSGLFSLVVTFPRKVADPDAPPPPPPPPAKGVVAPPDIDGFVICVDRQSVQGRVGKPFKRTIGQYQAFFNKQPIAGLHGTSVERQGPGDNTSSGVSEHRRIAAGSYPLFTHAGAQNKYRTFGFANPGGLQRRSWPSIRVGNTNKRSGILIHCAAGYLMSTGCINLTGVDLKRGKDDIEFFDSRARVIALVQKMKELLGDRFPSSNNVRIPDATLIIRKEPK